MNFFQDLLDKENIDPLILNVKKEKTTHTSRKILFYPKQDGISLISYFKEKEDIAYISIFNRGDCMLFSNKDINEGIINSISPFCVSSYKSKIKDNEFKNKNFLYQFFIKNKFDKSDQSIFPIDYVYSYLSFYISLSKNNSMYKAKALRESIEKVFFNQIKSFPIFTEEIQEKIFNKIIKSVIKDLNSPNGFKKIRCLFNLYGGRDYIISKYVVPVFLENAVYRDDLFESFLSFFDKYFTNRMFSEIEKIKDIAEFKSIFLEFGFGLNNFKINDAHFRNLSKPFYSLYEKKQIESNSIDNLPF